MRAYELMIIYDGDLDEAAVAKGLEDVNGLAAQEGASVAGTDNWGRRKFAYEIEHKQEGTYVVLELLTEAFGLDDLERNLRLADEVVRHKLLRLPDDEAARRGLFGSPATPVEAG